jgi:hypothetical protein
MFVDVYGNFATASHALNCNIEKGRRMMEMIPLLYLSTRYLHSSDLAAYFQKIKQWFGSGRAGTTAGQGLGSKGPWRVGTIASVKEAANQLTSD